jgi:peptide deformylase
LIREVLRYPDARLKAVAAECTDLAAAAAVVEDLWDTLAAGPRTVGVAAPQIGVELRICVVDCSGHPKVPDALGPLVLVNPVLSLGGETAVGREGCLSIPDLTGNVRRSVDVAVYAIGLDGSEVVVRASGFEARAIQHEVDHLDGVLFLDRVVSASDVFARKSRA